jgi:hypothetical protein
LNRHRTKYHKFKLSEGEKGIIPITLWGKPDSSGGEIYRRTRDKVRKRRLRESVLLSNVHEEIETWQGYSQYGYSLPAGHHCINMKCLYRYCSKHMQIMELRDINSNVYPEPENIMVKYFIEQIIEEGGDFTNSSRRIYTKRVYIYGDTITEYITANPEQNAQENDDIPPGIEALDEGYGYGSWIRASGEREIANCSVELDEVLGQYIVRCIVAELGADQELRLLIPKLVKSRRDIYSSKLKPAEVQEVLELGEEVLQEPIEERPQEATAIQTPSRPILSHTTT